MFYKDEILARLANGEDAQAIADDLAKTLNDAIQEHLDTQAENEKKSLKADRIAIIMEDILDFIEDYYPDLYDPELRDFDAKDLITLVDEAAEDARKISKSVSKLDKAIKDFSVTLDIPVEKGGDPIEEFLNAYVNK